MFYTLYRNPATGLVSVPGDRLAKTGHKAAKVATETYGALEAAKPDRIRIAERPGRTPVWTSFGVSWDGVTTDARVQQRLQSLFAAGKPVTDYATAPSPTGPSLSPAVSAPPDEALIKRLISEALKDFEPTATAAPQTLKVEGPRGTVDIQGLTHCAFPKVLRMMAKGPRAALLTGPAGCGKTRMAAQVAVALKLPFATINMSEGVTEGVLFGQRTLEPDGSTGWADGIVTDTFENGGLLFIDEMDNADPNLMVGINQILDGSKVVSMAHRVHKPMAKRHKDFLVLCGANTLLSGSAEYSSRNAMDGATVDRFMGAIVPVDYDRDLERRIITNKDALAIMWGFREFIKTAGLRGMRSSTRFGDTLQTVCDTRDEMIEQACLLIESPDLKTKCRNFLATYTV